MDGVAAFPGGNFAALIANFIGETVTIFTSSGGQSGTGFTGVVLAVNECFVRLITRVGPPPGCTLGNACTGFNVGYGCGPGYTGFAGGCGSVTPASEISALSAGGWDGYPVYTVGSVTDIVVSNAFLQ